MVAEGRERASVAWNHVARRTVSTVVYDENWPVIGQRSALGASVANRFPFVECSERFEKSSEYKGLLEIPACRGVAQPVIACQEPA
jgi:hypothetical protein